ncbi:Hypothetical predicted protein [Mytilus galloprovincialis]|uniref:Endonuclease/exonuclease/phosphatase domain-containing protein n=1 Tax=Mytilus galloprovincialis TaxID=29158 RepID=A0A8B6FLC4_MYTGA|nr:Hypothetical predicted protein [Mytilus galloprovincialis]
MANFNITKNINQISSQLQKSNTEESLQLANQQSQHFELETSNRFTQLSDDKNSDTDAVTERDTSSRKALLIGNSHVKRIRTGNFIQNCLVHKYIEHSCEGMMDKIEELDTDYECILLHVFTNNIRDDTVEECVQKTEELIDALRRHCQFAKIIISLPFLTIQDKALNNKIEECNILLQYKFLKHVYVTISNNSRLSSGNVPIKKFYGVDGLHLSNQGVSVFVAGIKFHMKNILQVTETLKMRQQASKPERGPKQNRHERSFSNQTHSSSQKANDQSPMSPFFMYPWGPGYNYNQMMYPPQMNDFHRKCNFFGLKDDIFICYIYNPPENSSYTKSLREDIFDLIEKDISKYSDTGKILLAGDLNARTGTQVLDFINNDESLDNIPVFDKISPDLNLPVRYSMDEVLSTRGKSLNEICIQSGLRILNGRTPGDFTGQLTCYSPNGSSVFDYFIASENLMENILFFNCAQTFGGAFRSLPNFRNVKNRL